MYSVSLVLHVYPPLKVKKEQIIVIEWPTKSATSGSSWWFISGCPLSLLIHCAMSKALWLRSIRCLICSLRAHFLVNFSLGPPPVSYISISLCFFMPVAASKCVFYYVYFTSILVSLSKCIPVFVECSETFRRNTAVIAFSFLSNTTQGLF